MGVDRSGALWAWSPHRSSVSIVSPGGERRQAYHLEEASTVDVDAEWGAAGLFNVNTQIAWFPGQDDRTPATTLQFPEQYLDICWLGPHRVAVSPRMSSKRIEIWDLESKKLISAFGEEIPLRLVPGATRMRGVLLRYDFQRQRLYTLESYTGDFQAFTLDGKVLWRAQVENPRRAAFDEWLKDMDRKAKAENDRQNPTILALGLSLASDGSVWVSHGLNLKTRTVTVGRLTPKGEDSQQTSKEEPCLGPGFLFWGEWFVSYKDTCTEARKWQ